MDIKEKRKAVYQELKKANLYSFGIGNIQEIKYTMAGKPYVTWKGSRKYLDNFLRFNTAWTGDNTDIIGKPSGAESDYNPFFIILDDRGESAFLYWYITN